MTDLLDYADRVWRGVATPESYLSGDLRSEGLHEVVNGVWMWSAFGNVFVFPTADGLVLFDTGASRTATSLHRAVRDRWSDPLTTAIYSHGHVDHVFGLDPFDREATDQGRPRPTVIAHEAVPARFDRYRRSAGHNTAVNRRQFRDPELVWPTEYRYPDVTYRETTEVRHGDLTLRLQHVLAETDDHTVAWWPERGILCCGDLFTWAAPNAGNPQKVQRYPLEWARALRWMAELNAQLLLPGHGLPIAGAARIRQALTDSAALLESLHDQVLELMNTGATLDEVLHRVTPPTELLEKPYLRPLYDEPEFVIHAVWRRYGGWWGGDPAQLKPAPRSELAHELATLAGGAEQLANRARSLAEDGRLRLAGHLAQLAGDAAPDGAAVHDDRAEVFRRLEDTATSTMARGVYGWAVAESEAVTDSLDVTTTLGRAAAARPTRITL
ncbi:alkyl sulfatase dimerization domain-containing protein [Haloactinomyces albus]|uniref:Alkyl sulfatase BDS1-like metallo-beta-lactamase superfamily hydrolase n=1 Tax=Haloactinomyces albus TaxID=1352928 RepID=A0AAE3ZI87_9ACTN|nr:alkyl sulfatase dimerization domain-containing protein [Haloactinomyces albus]MDR7304099.1 alkyl sulfatase BDS1-like metallo-beta-lactamase superfamily hydrolase [Haloactinomyces albus]